MSRRYALALAAGAIAIAVIITIARIFVLLSGRVDGAWLL